MLRPLQSSFPLHGLFVLAVTSAHATCLEFLDGFGQAEVGVQDSSLEVALGAALLHSLGKRLDHRALPAHFVGEYVIVVVLALCGVKGALPVGVQRLRR